MDNTQKPLLSIGMIVKNESRSLEKCLKALQPLRDAFPCELVIADTGSTDNTREIAARYADILFDFQWVNDFSAARNAVMDRCTGQWFLTIDADEYLDPDLSGFYALFRLDKKDWPTTCFIRIRNYTSPDLEHSAYSDFFGYRMARLGMGIHYTGIIHEMLTVDGATQGSVRIRRIPQILLHHDGYAFESEEARIAKGKRNLTLLDRDLEKNPKSGYRLIQCIESANAFPEKAQQYAKSGMKYLQAGEVWGENLEVVEGILAARCAITAVQTKMDEAEEWIQWVFEHYPNSMAVQIDLSYFASFFAYQHGNYEDVLKFGTLYCEAMEKYQHDQFSHAEYLMTVLQQQSRDMEYTLYSLLAIAKANLHMEQEALSQLSDWPYEDLSKQNLIDWMKALLPLWYRPEAAELMAGLIRYFEDNTDRNEWFYTRKRGVERYALSLLRQSTTDDPESKNSWRLLLRSPGQLGLSARVLDTDQRIVAEQLLTEVSDWTEFSPAVIAHAFNLGARFPDSLIKQEQRLKQKLITNLSTADPQFNESLKGWLENNQGESLPRIRFDYHMLIAALQQGEKLSKDQMLDFTKLFIKMADKSLHKLYHPDLWENEEDQFELPLADRYAICILDAKQKYEKGDFNGCVNDLHKALKIAPSMKDVVDIILKQVEKRVSASRLSETASKELLELADKVRTILAQYPPNDPSVVVLKQSEVYQKVAYLIEGMEAPVFGGLSQ